jgi:hypothetical protein
VSGTLVAGDVIESARGLHPSFNKLRHPDPLLIRALSRYQRELLARIIRLDSSLAVAFFDQALPLADFSAGIAVPPYKYPFGAAAISATGKQHHMDLVSWEASKLYHHAAYLLNGVLFLAGKEHNWTSYATIRFLYVPEPSAVTLSLGGTLDALPEAAESVVVSYLGLVMASRGGADDGMAKPNPSEFRVDWTQAEQRFFDEIGRHTQAQTSVVRDVT